MIPQIGVWGTTVLLLAGCSWTQEQPIPPATPTPPSSLGADSELGTHSAALGAVTAPVSPTRVQVPSLGIDVTVSPVGVEADGFMEIPPDVTVAGWYKYGSNPGGDTGTTVIAAHVDSPRYGIGPFAALKDASVGEVVSVTSADGVVHEYAIESVSRIEKARLPLDDVFDREGAPRLALITCGGQFDYGAGHYEDNIVVIAIPTTP